MVDSMQVPDDPCFRFLNWDSAHFGLRIGRVLPVRFDTELSRQALMWAREFSIDCMYLLLAAEDAAAIRTAAGCGWRMVDIRVTLGAPAVGDGEHDSHIRTAKLEDIPALRRIAAQSHKDSRFYADGNFPSAKCDDLFATWIERSVREREFAGLVLVPETQSNQPAGYVTCSITDGQGRIGLVAVDEKARGMGWGTRLVAESIRWSARHGAERISVVTQGCNVAALRMYERCGFRVESVQLWFHWWRVRSEQLNQPY